MALTTTLCVCVKQSRSKDSRIFNCSTNGYCNVLLLILVSTDYKNENWYVFSQMCTG